MTAPRLDLFAGIHKGLRALMAHVLVRVGRLDPHDLDDVAEVTEDVRALLTLCASHVHHENRVIHPALEARHPGSSAQTAVDHVRHEDAIAALGALVERVGGDDEAARELYRDLAAFVAHNLEHMEFEETHHNGLLWEAYSDVELMALHQNILSQLTPQEMQLGMRWILPHVNPAQRAGMLGGLRQAAPPQVFEHMLALVRPQLGGRDWRKLSTALAL